MSGNGASPKSLKSEVLALLEDQLALASLEWRYEKKRGVRRLAALAAAGVLVLFAIALLQAALVLGMVDLGLKAVYACLTLAGLYLVIAAFLVAVGWKRPAQVGSPFQATREELKKNLQWIHQILS